MPAFYSVIQFVPDEVTDERINFGVVAFGDGQSRVHFIDNWHRVRHFAGRDIGFLKEFVRDAPRMSEAAIRRVIETWTHAIQFTKPAPSLLPLDALLLDVAERFLVDPPRDQRGYRLRGDAVRMARSEVRQELVKRLGGVGRLYLKKERSALFGRRGPHPFDVTVGNGQPIFAAQAISFEVPDQVKVAREADAAAWAIKDVKEANEGLPIAVVAIAPPEPGYVYEKAAETFRELRAEIVPEAGLKEWAARMVESVPESMHGGQN